MQDTTCQELLAKRSCHVTHGISCTYAIASNPADPKALAESKTGRARYRAGSFWPRAGCFAVRAGRIGATAGWSAVRARALQQSRAVHQGRARQGRKQDNARLGPDAAGSGQKSGMASQGYMAASRSDLVASWGCIMASWGLQDGTAGAAYRMQHSQ